MYEHKKVSKNLLVWSFVLVVMAAIAVANIEPVTPPANPDEQSTTTTEARQAPQAAENNSSSDQPTIGKPIQTFTFGKDFGIRDALAMLAKMYRKNIVPTQNVDGVLAFRSLSNVTFTEAMDAILGDKFKYLQEGNLIKVYSKDEYKKLMEAPERMITQVFTLYYISAAEAMKLITPVLSKAGSIQASSPAQTTVSTGESITAGAFGGDSMALNDTLVILDYPENIQAAEKLLKELDKRPRQVLVEATILSATLTEETALGIDWNTLNGVSIDTIANIGTGIANGLATGGFASAVSTTKSSGGLNVGITSDHLAVFIRALESVTDVTILANPKILAVNKQLGQVYIGNKIGYVSQTTQTQTSTTQQVQFLDTGTKLSFRPYIGNDGYIRMDIHPKDSSGTLKANNIPDESSTELATNIMVKDGQTIVIGGLFRDKISTTRNQVPLLGDLPIVGAAFRGTADYNEREEVIVMLTPHIVKEPADTKSLARAEDIARKRLAAKEELQSIDRARLAEDYYTKAATSYAQGDMDSALLNLARALKYRPAYLEAIRLKERIIEETDPDAFHKMERTIRQKIEQEDSKMWLRR